MEHQIFDNYKNRLYKSQAEIYKACKGDGFLLGRVMLLIKHYKEQKDVATQVSSGIVPVPAPLANAANPEKSEGVCGNGECEGKTESVCCEDTKKQPRKKVPRKIRILRNESLKSEEGLSRYERFWNLVKGTCCLRFFRKSTKRDE